MAQSSTLSPILSLQNLSKKFGSNQANDAISLDIYKGKILALLGENGAGKTTLVNILFGHYLPDTGKITIAKNLLPAFMQAQTQAQKDDDAADDAMVSLPLGNPQTAIKAGIGMVHQHFTLAENLNALDNIMLGTEPLFRWKRNISETRAKLETLMQQTGLHVPLDEKASHLSVGERQRVEILKALFADAKILVLDEPTAVLTPQEAESLFKNLRTLTKKGLSIIFISHKLHEVIAFSDHIAILRNGKKVSEMQTADADEKKITNAMVGRTASKNVFKSDKKQAKTRTRHDISCQFDKVCAKGNSQRASLKEVSFELYDHEILGIAGVSGNGQKLIADCLSGLRAPQSGNIFLNGNVIKNYSPASMIKAGVGRIPEDRHHMGVIGNMNFAENFVIERLDSPDFQKYGFLKNRAIQTHAEQACEQYDVRGVSKNSLVRLLSGGNMQKLILARIFQNNPKIILANQPTRGLDVKAAGDVYQKLLDARNEGNSVILISEDLDEILTIADRIMVIQNGQLALAEKRTRAMIGLMMAGENPEKPLQKKALQADAKPQKAKPKTTKPKTTSLNKKPVKKPAKKSTKQKVKGQI